MVIHWINDLPNEPNTFPLKDAIDPTHRRLRRAHGPAVPHLHGGHTAARFDGTPMQWWTRNGKTGPDYVTDTFTYLNDQPAALSGTTTTPWADAPQPLSRTGGGLPDLRQRRQRHHDQRPESPLRRLPPAPHPPGQDVQRRRHPVLSDPRHQRRPHPSGCPSSSATRRWSTARPTPSSMPSHGATGCASSTVRTPASTTCASTKGRA